MFSQIKDRNIIEQNFHSVAKDMLRGAGGVKNFSVGICDGAPSTARSSYFIASLLIMGTSLKGKNLLPEGANYFL